MTRIATFGGGPCWCLGTLLDPLFLGNASPLQGREKDVISSVEMINTLPESPTNCCHSVIKYLLTAHMSEIPQEAWRYSGEPEKQHSFQKGHTQFFWKLSS